MIAGNTPSLKMLYAYQFTLTISRRLCLHGFIRCYSVSFSHPRQDERPAHVSLQNCFDLLMCRAPNSLLFHHAKSFKASVASLAQPLKPHQPPAVAHNSACPLGWASQEGSRARTPRTPKHSEQLEVPSSHPTFQQNNQNKENL